MVVRIMIKMNGTVQSLDFANQTGFRQLVQIAVNRRQTDVRRSFLICSYTKSAVG